MEQTSSTAGAADQDSRWVAMWRQAVRASSLAIGLVQLSTRRFVEISPRAAELLGTTPEDGLGLDYLAFTERPQEAVQTFRLVEEGMLDGIRGRRRFRRPDGAMEERQLTGWAIRSSTWPHLGLWIVSEPAEVTDDAAAGEVVVPSPWGDHAPDGDDAQVTLDDHWCIARVTTTSELLLGRRPDDLVDNSILELTHEGDRAALLLAFARATTDPGAEVQIRVRHPDGGWRVLRAAITVLDGEGALPFGLVLSSAVEAELADLSGAVQLAGHLRRVASQIEAAGVMASLIERAAALGVPATAELSPRQWEIASRLVRGERVTTIAAEMYLSQGTVRNHLSAIFQKFGVHSQAELLSLWRAGARGMREHS
jgi:PAS domain-containing protein/DNA-binding CsgD family transcriptional regulator